MRARFAVAVGAALLMGGCFGMRDERPWKPAGKAYSDWRLFGADVEVALPPGWMKINHLKNGLVATRDGFNLHTLRLRRIALGKKLPHTLKVVGKAMRPDELAEVLLDDLRTDGTANGLEVLETGPATFAGRPGFRASVAFKDSDGLRYRAILTGAIIDGYAWQFSHIAAARHYYDRYLTDFERSLATIEID